MAFETEEQQIEAIKSFWRENGVSIIVGVVIGLGGIWGWRFYNDEKIASQELHSQQYEQVLKTIVTDQAKVEDFVATNKDIAYGHLAALQLAKVYVENDQLDKAVEQLKVVIENGDKLTLMPIASLRAARVYLVQDKYEEALGLLNKPLPEAFSAEAAEIKGDVLAQQGKAAEARLAYQAAADAGGLETSPMLQLKIDNLVTDGV